MRHQAIITAGLILCLALPLFAQRRRTPAPRQSSGQARPAGLLRYGTELKSATGEPVCRELFLRGQRPVDDVLLDYVAGTTIGLIEGFFAYRACRVDPGKIPPEFVGLGPWAVVDVAGRNVNYPRMYLFDEARSTPAWRRNLVAYWGIFIEPLSGAVKLQAVVYDWQHRLIVARQAIELEVPGSGEPLPAPRWVSPIEVHFRQGEKKYEVEIAPGVVR